MDWPVPNSAVVFAVTSETKERKKTPETAAKSHKKVQGMQLSLLVHEMGPSK
jgi:hypothetical protein